MLWRQKHAARSTMEISKNSKKDYLCSPLCVMALCLSWGHWGQIVFWKEELTPVSRLSSRNLHPPHGWRQTYKSINLNFLFSGSVFNTYNHRQLFYFIWHVLWVPEMNNVTVMGQTGNTVSLSTEALFFL